MANILTNFPDISVTGEDIKKLFPPKKETYAPISNLDFRRVNSSFGTALHMHQPTIINTDDCAHIHRAGLISNLQYMMEHQNIGDNHNAPVFLKCYSRTADIIRDLTAQHKNPRVMLDYSGNLFWALEQIDEGRVLDNIRSIASAEKYFPYVEWLGTMWSHAVVTSTPIPDIKLHLAAWRKHFASLFGMEAVKRVKGFSPPEMHLPIHPDVCFEYVAALKECGYSWLLAQEHTIENLDGSGIKRPHFPHRLVAKNSKGETAQITVLIKTKGSDTKLVGQMQPYAEAKSVGREDYCGKNIPSYVAQIGDGENGGVMMNEFPDAFIRAFGEIEKQGTVSMNGSEYLEFIQAAGINENDFIPVQPVSQHRIWELIGADYHQGAADEAIKKIHAKDQHFNLDRGSWTNDKNWVKGYEHVLDPINKLSVVFHAKYGSGFEGNYGDQYPEALLYLLLSQTSCFRYWGSGIWTEYAKEICRRGMSALGA